LTEGKAAEINQNPERTDFEPEIILIAENEKDKFKLKINQLLYIESADNYSNVVYFGEAGQRKKELIRSSLKRLEGQLNNENIIRCHRTFIVNLINVKIVGGNAAGYKLYFDTSDETIPVSRNYIPIVGEKLKHLK
jgi:DNA-binding LytR/AlgR family response regulator